MIFHVNKIPKKHQLMIKEAREALHGRIKKHIIIEESKHTKPNHHYVTVKFLDKRNNKRVIGDVGFYKNPGDKNWKWDYTSG